MAPQHELEVDPHLAPRDKLEEIIAWLRSPSAPRTHAEVERAIHEQSWELLRAAEQGFLDDRFARELENAAQLPAEPGVKVRVRQRWIEGEFGRVIHRRLGYARAGQGAVLPADQELNLPKEMYSLEVRHRAGFEAQRSCLRVHCHGALQRHRRELRGAVRVPLQHCQ